MGPTDLSPERIDAVLDAVYRWSRRQGYRGYNKHDGLNSPLLRALLGRGKWPRLIAIQSVMRAPVNLRPWLGVHKTYNAKGIALFARGLLDRYRASGEAAHLSEARELLRLLDGLRSPGAWSGDCWGYPYPWQDLGFFAPAKTPNAVVTAFACETYLDAYRLTGETEYLDRVRSALDFFANDLTVLKDTEDELCLGYMPMPMTMRVMDVSILIGSVTAQYGALTGDTAFDDRARRLVKYVLRRQTYEGAWFYTDPPSDSPIRHDNYHTGFILDALWNYMEATGDRMGESGYAKGLAFYAENLFNADGSPRWMSDRDYPHDIHGAAQGIITFARHRPEYPELADRIAAWALDTMYHPDGRFHYQQTRRLIKRFTLLRWCNAWMARALACLRATPR
jgi:hypothetical protein